MRTEEECKKMLKDSIEKCNYWQSRINEFIDKEEEYQGQLNLYKSNYISWMQRVKTLEYVLGIRDSL